MKRTPKRVVFTRTYRQLLSAWARAAKVELGGGPKAKAAHFAVCRLLKEISQADEIMMVGYHKYKARVRQATLNKQQP